MPELNLDAARAQWLEHLARDRRLAPNSVKTYTSALHQAFAGVAVDPAESDLRAAVDRRLNHPSGHIRRSSFVALSQFFRWWEKQGGPANLLAEAKVPPTPRSRRSALTAAELDVLEGRLALAQPKDRAEVLLMLRCGFRVGDVVQLRAEDVDFDQGQSRWRRGSRGRQSD
jgi:integrase